MPPCIPFSFRSTAEHDTATPQPRSLRLAASTASSASSSDAPAAVVFDDAASIVTLPSLPSLQSSVPISGYLNTTPPPAFHFCLASLKSLRPTSSAAALAVSAAASLLYSASDSEITVFDLVTVRQVETFDAVPSAGSVKFVALSSAGKLFTAHQDGRIRVWRRSARSGRHRLNATLPTAVDRLLRFPLPGNYVAIRRHKKLMWIEHADAVSAVAARGDLLYSVSWDKTLKVWRAAGDLRCLESVPAHEDAVNAVAVAGDGTVYTGSADGKIRVWARSPPEEGRGRRRRHTQHGLVATLKRHRSAVNALALSGDGAVLYSGACDRSILVWEREESADHMAVAGALRGHQKAILCLACVGDVLFSGSSDRTVRIWRKEGEGKGYSCLGVMEGHSTGVRSLVAVPVPAPAELQPEPEEEYRVGSGSLDGEVRVWRVRIPTTQRSDSK
ncbi:WD domain, G-beta repeat [Musa troglodytarum]|uniref:WD domain, G-beta repeat n=1 Tax=Musa troglodytarum TaxID=320322 RepID=A0A9E7L695_9LILI|nr:WD domain, G-beta repeat [Musa troglodytarum]